MSNSAMRGLIILMFSLKPFLSWAQESNPVTKYFFCGLTVPASPDCQYEETYMNFNGKNRPSGVIIKQGSQFIQWTYYNYIPDQVKGEFVDQMLGQFLPQKEKNLKGYRKKPKKFIALDQPLEGWLIEKKYRDTNKCFLFASGVINKEHVIIYCGLTQKPKNNTAIPKFMRQLIQFE